MTTKIEKLFKAQRRGPWAFRAAMRADMNPNGTCNRAPIKAYFEPSERAKAYRWVNTMVRLDFVILWGLPGTTHFGKGFEAILGSGEPKREVL